MTKKIIQYTVYHDGEQASRTYKAKPWILTIRAESVKQAMDLAAEFIVCPDLVRKKNMLRLYPTRKAGVGIVSVDHLDGPKMLKQWPFPFDIGNVGNNWNVLPFGEGE